MNEQTKNAPGASNLERPNPNLHQLRFSFTVARAERADGPIYYRHQLVWTETEDWVARIQRGWILGMAKRTTVSYNLELFDKPGQRTFVIEAVPTFTHALFQLNEAWHWLQRNKDLLPLRTNIMSSKGFLRAHEGWDCFPNFETQSNRYVMYRSHIYE